MTYVLFLHRMIRLCINQINNPEEGQIGITQFTIYHLTILPQSRFKCQIGCGVEYATTSYPMARVHALDCPTKAFITSNWRPSSKSVLAQGGFFFRHNAAIEDDYIKCTCPERCDAVHVVE